MNESPTEKLIRELKEENERLKKMVEGGGSPSGDPEEYARMLEHNKKEMEEREKSWQQKLEEAQANASKEEKKVNLDVPNIANLSEDPQLDRLAVYDVATEDKTFVGRKRGKPTPSIIMGGPGIQLNHAYFENKDGDIYLKPNSKESKGQIKVNGKEIGKGVKLNHSDRIVFGAASMFIFRLPGQEDDHDIDYEMAQDEVNAELKAQQEEKLEQDRLEEEEKVKEIEAKFEEEQERKKEEQEREKEEQERRIKELEEKLKTEQEEEEKQKAEEQKRKVEEEIRKREEEARLARLKALEEKEEQKRLLEKKRKEHQRLDETLNTLLPMVKEANISAEELKRKISFEPTIVHEVEEKPGQSPLEELKNSKSKVKVRIVNKEDGSEYMWNPDKFSDRLYMIRDVMNDYFDTGKLPKLDKEEDPFWDPEEAHLIGRAYLYLKALGNMFENISDCKILNTNSQSFCGNLHVGVQPTDETGEADDCPEELMVDDPKELLGKSIDFNVIIGQATGLPENLCKDTYVKFGWYLNNQDFQTETIQGVDKNPNYQFKHHINIDCVTEDLLKYIEHDALSFKVYGNPTSAKFKKQLTMADKKKKEAKKSNKEESKKEEIPKGKSSGGTKEVKKVEKKTKVVKMTTPDGQVVEVVKEKQG